MSLHNWVQDICAKLQEEKEFVLDTSEMALRRLLAAVISNGFSGINAANTIEGLLKELLHVNMVNAQLAAPKKEEAKPVDAEENAVNAS